MGTRAIISTLILTLLLSPLENALSAVRSEKPNIILILADDLGYGDLKAFNRDSALKAPNLERMAREGTIFTEFYAGQSESSPARAALWTGCYPARVGITKDLEPRSELGLSLGEITIPELIKIRGYATALLGDWHLGDGARFLPNQQGFDQWFGLAYPHDMWPHHPTRPGRYPELPLFLDESVINAAMRPQDQEQLTARYSDRAVEFISKNKKRPFFLCLAHHLPHVPLSVSPRFDGSSGQGRYGDAVAELDWSVGQILAALKRENLDERTWVIFTSDNGPWLTYGNHAGSAHPLQGGKGSVLEGGFRVPCIMRWPGRVPAGKVCRELASTMDLLPTIAALLRLALPGDRVIDGRDIRALMFGEPGARTPHEAFFYYNDSRLLAVRSGPWKLVLGHTYSKPATPGQDGQPGPHTRTQLGPALFNLKNDPGERHDATTEHPQVVARLQELLEQARTDLGDGPRQGKNHRPAGQLQAAPL